MDEVILPIGPMYSHPERRYPFLEKVFELCKKRNRKIIKRTPRGRYNWGVYYTDSRTGRSFVYVLTVTYDAAARTIYALQNSGTQYSNIDLYIKRIRSVTT